MSLVALIAVLSPMMIGDVSVFMDIVHNGSGEDEITKIAWQVLFFALVCACQSISISST